MNEFIDVVELKESTELIGSYVQKEFSTLLGLPLLSVSDTVHV
jgi:hypothetical protein